MTDQASGELTAELPAEQPEFTVTVTASFSADSFDDALAKISNGALRRCQDPNCSGAPLYGGVGRRIKTKLSTPPTQRTTND